MKMLVSLRYLMRRTVAGRRELVWNPTSFIRGQLMHTNTAAGKGKNFLGLYVGTNHVGVSLCDAKTSACIGLWPPLNRNKDMITLAKELKKLIEEHKVWLLVVGRPWIKKESINIEIAKKSMEENRIAGFVMCPLEGQDENYSSDEVAMVESFIKDLTNTGVLRGFKCSYYTARVFVCPWAMKRKIEELKVARDPRFLFKDWTELEDFHAMYASEFMLLHYVRYFVIPFLDEKKGVECTIKRRALSAIVEDEILPNVYAFFLVP
ncbi:hypothetical protein LWI29_024159 [Acer saccharum]|uniref:Uncharacterized protein n=1 Tax=Acer saccharum TaxID=4024 RepID=A0AA39VE23_ACESA|nr:hypothetical protein LWI29_024159 [Acer saccharum]